MKYRPSPFHLVSIWFLYDVVNGFRLNAKLGDKAELGALLPFIYLGFFLATLLLDLVIQFIISAKIKGDWKMIYLTQIIIIVIIAIIKFPTVYNAD